MNKLKPILRYFIPSLAAFLLLEKPAFADTGTFWGFYGTNTPILLGLPIKGIALVVVILIEMAVFARIWRISWLRALGISFTLNLISSIAGIIIGLLYLWGFETGIVLIIIFFAILFLAAIGKYLPLWLTFFGSISIVIGTFAASHNNVILKPLSQWGFLAALILPLLVGFGFTLFAEGWGTKLFTIATNKWRGLMWANVASYIFLTLMVIVVGPNPYTNAINLQWPSFFGDSISEHFSGHSMYNTHLNVDEMTKILHGRRISNLVMLGLKKDTPLRNYDAVYELDLLKSSYYYSDYTNPQYGFAIIGDTIDSTDLKPDAMEKFEWYLVYLGYFKQAVEAIKKHDQNALNIVYFGWKFWSNKNPFPYDIIDAKFGATNEPINNAIEFFKSDLIMPEKSS